MVTLNKIYTKTGDDGTTALVSGERRVKHDLRVEAYGTVDELNAFIGAARLDVADPHVDNMLNLIQNDCFDLGADLANPQSDSDMEFEPLRVVDTQVSKLEGYIDELNAELSPLKSFVLPGGSRAAANLHQARTIARRAERVATHLAEQANEEVNPLAIKYLNRLSDFLFVAARWCNNKGADDVLWIPGKNR
ncbi:cob(I)yrinic acid a,c-diamide adenosyltransferase [Lentilitoribacter sp. Alg239-R112]|uniref:cob(I)yrinic acid a,c-diamide adenosyltransferase n=1 Tax=Lentilitoribacter sp. Alg239-R112 TaxID=2305987 RepID=UPI0013A6E4D8|nr:cob(I)yrinic acid a,c-diamide adenosyltransferase [Lentilitoribacter sp. Alg239-R112]